MEEKLTRKEEHELKEPIHEFFGLSYANYLTIPRCVLQSMPIEWQERFCEMLNEINECIEWGHEDCDYKVLLVKQEDYDDEFEFTVHRNGKEEFPHDDDYSQYRRNYLPLLKIPSTTKIYYFGCIREAGHYLFGPGLGENVIKAAPGGVCLPWKKIDATLAPKNTRVQGKALYHNKDGFSAVAFWDNTVDKRPGSNSVFFFFVNYSFSLVVRYAQEKFPKIFKRFDFPIERIFEDEEEVGS